MRLALPAFDSLSATLLKNAWMDEMLRVDTSGHGREIINF